jgi:hypothetical protein
VADRRVGRERAADDGLMVTQSVNDMLRWWILQQIKMQFPWRRQTKKLFIQATERLLATNQA